LKTSTTLVLFPAIATAALGGLSKEAVMSEIETVGVILTIAVVLMLVWSRYKLT
jgi:hypothetical protein